MSLSPPLKSGPDECMRDLVLFASAIPHDCGLTFAGSKWCRSFKGPVDPKSIEGSDCIFLRLPLGLSYLPLEPTCPMLVSNSCRVSDPPLVGNPGVPRLEGEVCEGVSRLPVVDKSILPALPPPGLPVSLPACSDMSSKAASLSGLPRPSHKATREHKLLCASSSGAERRRDTRSTNVCLLRERGMWRYGSARAWAAGFRCMISPVEDKRFPHRDKDRSCSCTLFPLTVDRMYVVRAQASEQRGAMIATVMMRAAAEEPGLSRQERES